MHSNVFGTMQTRLLGRQSYLLIFVDERTCYTWMFSNRNKNNVFEHFIGFKSMSEKQTYKHI